MVSLLDDVYIVGGSGEHGNLCEILHSKQWLNALTLEALDVEWINGPDMLASLHQPIAVAMHAKLWVIFTPDSQNNPNNQVLLHCLDTISMSGWENKKPPPDGTMISGAVAVGSGHRLLLVGGNERICLGYDVNTDCWEAYDCLPAFYHHSGHVVMDENEVVLLGGFDGDQWNTHVEQYHEDWVNVKVGERRKKIKKKAKGAQKHLVRNSDKVEDDEYTVIDVMEWKMERKWRKSRLPPLPVILDDKEILFISMKNFPFQQIVDSATSEDTVVYEG